MLKLPDIVAQGAVGFKLFMGCQVGGLNVDDDQALQDGLKEVAKLGVPVAVHAEDKAILTANETKLKASQEKRCLQTFWGTHRSS